MLIRDLTLASLSFVAFLGAVVWGVHRVRATRDWLRVTGKIDRFDTVLMGDTSCQFPYVSYRVAGQAFHSPRASEGSDGKFWVGQAVSIFVNPRDLNKYLIDDASIWITPTIVAGFFLCPLTYFTLHMLKFEGMIYGRH